MAFTYQFEDHLREHRSSRLGQRLWWVPAAAGVGVAIADGMHLAGTPYGQLSAVLACALPLIAALLLLVDWVALSVADWTYPAEKHSGRQSTSRTAGRARTFSLAVAHATSAH